ncbi:microtubule-actin cross-linking factor 1 isoform X1 [Lates japonicus]|uniref:Microtubule-actin cross-linking factor 1 isoform X1 n=1 Tax=Lates japonicus TaxID=270547 RepID=A0AAD3MSY1_LATJO|nr:microtubule-actin cross-linking factor 1 isoform X1 [Lates japonicus]
MESSDDDTLSERSCVSEPSFRSERSGGSLSPCPSGLVGPPGDTLPWNLSKHERRKRKSQDSVLDPAERAVVRVAEVKDQGWDLTAFEHQASLMFASPRPTGVLCSVSVELGLTIECNGSIRDVMEPGLCKDVGTTASDFFFAERARVLLCLFYFPVTEHQPEVELSSHCFWVNRTACGDIWSGSSGS